MATVVVDDSSLEANSQPKLVSYLVFYDTFSTNRLHHAIEVGYVSHRAGGEHKYHAIKQQKNTTRVCAAEMAVRYAALSACRKVRVSL